MTTPIFAVILLSAGKLIILLGFLLFSGMLLVIGAVIVLIKILAAKGRRRVPRSAFTPPPDW